MFNWWKLEARQTRYEVRKTTTSDNENSVKNGKDNQPKSHTIKSFY